MSPDIAATFSRKTSLDIERRPQTRTTKQSKEQSRRPLALPFVMRRAVTDSPTFHRDPARSSSSDNGSLASPFSFPKRPYDIPGGPRDSVTTHNSSLYPPSTSSYSNNSPPFPSSPSSASFSASILSGNDDPSDAHEHILDADDVSYRLKLLMRNNYFLPPAHSKPSQSELSLLAVESAAAPPSKSPTFRDFFRVGRSRAQPSRSPTNPQSTLAPVPPPLRQVKSHNALRPQVPDSSFSSTTTSSSRGLSEGGPSETKGRVVVIREKVEDIAVAAQEAEAQMRAQQAQAGAAPRGSTERGRARSSSSRSRRRHRDDDLVDPTDAVDLPSYSFQPQASNFHGLGLGVDSAGLSAAVLADQLPPGSLESGLTKEDIQWRKALLHQAVGLSMMSIASSASTNSSHSSPVVAKVASTPSPAPFQTPRTTTVSAAILPILEDINFAVPQSTPKPARRKDNVPTMSMASRPPPREVALARSLGHPHRGAPSPAPRSETPAFPPTTPLQPPPRRNPSGPRQVEANPPPTTGEVKLHMFPSDTKEETIKKTLSKPLLSEGYETDKTAQSSFDAVLQLKQPLSPTLLVQDPDGRQSVPPGARQVLQPSGTNNSITSGSIYSDDESHRDHETTYGQTTLDGDDVFTRPRPSFAANHPYAMTRASDDSARPSQESGAQSSSQPRPSMSDSHQSHFSHAFGPRDAPYDGPRDSLSPELRRKSPSPQLSTRLHSSIAPARLSAVGGLPAPTADPVTPEPRTSDLNARRGQHLKPLDLSPQRPISGTHEPVASAPLDFFDRIQVESPPLTSGWLDDPMDDDDGDDDGPQVSNVIYVDQAKTRSRVSSNAGTVVPSPRKGMFAIGGSRAEPEPQTIMRLPNSSNPYLQPGSFGGLDPSKPLTNIAPPGPTSFLSSLASSIGGGSSKESTLQIRVAGPSLGRALSPGPSPGRIKPSVLERFSPRKPKIPESTYDLMRYAQDAKARSTPSLSPSKKLFPEVPGRRSNVDSGGFLRPISPYTFGRKSSEFVAAWTKDQVSNQNPEARKLDGLLTQHMEQERELIKKMTKNKTGA